MTRPAPESEPSPIPATLAEARRVASLIFDADLPAPQHDPTLPHINGYELTARLGAGGSGEVFDAIRTNDSARVAIKVLRRTLGSGPDSKRIWREIDLLADLRHPCVPRVLTQGTLPDGRPYIVFEHIAGTTLDIYAGARRLSRRQRVELIAKTAEAVQSLHDRGIIHRDIKPSNIIINVHRDPVIIDLGVASLTDRSALETLTTDGAPLGTPAFMSPEQARGERASITTRSDVYALGATAYAVLTGTTPHDMNTTLHEAIRRVAFDAPRPPRDLDPTIDASLDAVLRKAVAPDPAQRYASALEFAHDLRRWLAGEPVEAKKPSTWQRAARWATRHPIAFASAASLIVSGLIVGSTVASISYLNGRPYDLIWGGAIAEPARLVDRLGNPLRVWPVDELSDSVIMFAGRADRKGESSLAIIAEYYGTSSKYTGLLCAYEFDDYHADPLWIMGVDGVDISKPAHITGSPPDDAPDPLPGHFVTGPGLIADIFPEVPGDEIVATHFPNPWSATAIRVYSTDGEVLYEAWHDGRLQDMHWFPQKKRLMLVGVNSEERYEHLGSPTGNHALVILAIEPIIAKTDRLLTEHLCPDRLQPKWYKVLPTEIVTHMRFGSVTHSIGRDIEAGVACVNLESMEDRNKDSHNPRILSLYIDADGVIVRIRANDSFRKDEPFDLDSARSRILTILEIN